MATVIINKFDGGHAEDLRTFATNQSEKSLNFNIFDKPHLLQPYVDTVAETVTAGTTSDHKMSDVIDSVSLSGDGYIALGQAGASDANLKFFSKSTVTDPWTKRAEQSAGTVIGNTLVGYKGFAYALEGSGSGINLVELTNTSTITDKGTISNESTACKPFVHPEDNLLYIGAGDTLARYDGVNDIDSATGSSIIITDLLPTGTVVKSMTNYGTYLAIACGNNEGKAIAYLWGRDSTVNTFQGIVDFGKGELNVIENIGDILIGIVYQKSATSFVDKIAVKAWSGGQVQTLKEIEVTYVGTANPRFKAKSKDKLYFITGEADCIYSVGKNKDGSWAITKDRYMFNGTTPSGINGFTVIDDYFWIGFVNSGGDSLFYRSVASTYTNTSVYKTTINPAMPIADRSKDKQLKAVQVLYTGASSGTTVLKYSVDGSSLTTLISDTNSTGEQVIQATNENSAGAVLLAGREFQFQVESTGGAKIKEIKYSYDVLNDII